MKSVFLLSIVTIFLFSPSSFSGLFRRKDRLPEIIASTRYICEKSSISLARKELNRRVLMLSGSLPVQHQSSLDALVSLKENDGHRDIVLLKKRMSSRYFECIVHMWLLRMLYEKVDGEEEVPFHIEMLYRASVKETDTASKKGITLDSIVSGEAEKKMIKDGDVTDICFDVLRCSGTAMTCLCTAVCYEKLVAAPVRK